MRNLSKWCMLFCTLFVALAPTVFALSDGKTDAKPIETGKQDRGYVHSFSPPVIPIKFEPRVVSSPSPTPSPTPAPTPVPTATPAPEVTKEPVKEKPKQKETPKPEKRGEEFKATAYTIGKGQVPNLKGITATGTKVKKGRTIAVDPKVIPLGSLVYIESDFPGITGEYIAEDTGSAIKGKKIDVFFGWGGKGTEAYKEAMEFGNKQILYVTILREGFEKRDAI